MTFIALRKQVGLNIQHRRKLRNLTLEGLGLMCNMERASLCRIEQGKANPSILTLERIAIALDVELPAFFR